MSGAWTEIDPFGSPEVNNPSASTNGAWTEIDPFLSTDRVNPSGSTNGLWTEFRLIYGGIYVDGAVHF